MLIGELADRTGVTAKTLRFNECGQLLPEPQRTSGGYRDYQPDAVDRVTFIRQAQAAGLTLAQIGQMSSSATTAKAPAPTPPNSSTSSSRTSNARSPNSGAARDQLRQLSNRARRLDPGDCIDICHIIQPDRPSKP